VSTEIVSLRGYDLSYDGLAPRQGPNYRELVGKFTVREGGRIVGIMEPSKRSFPARNDTTTQAALMTRGFSQLYLSLGETNSDGSIVLRHRVVDGALGAKLLGAVKALIEHPAMMAV
jgi:cytochrome c-type biogenesis protein CcmF